MKKNSSDIPINIFYNHKNNKPGQYPFKHGIYPEMYRKRLWTMRQYSGFSTAKESNKRYHHLLQQGVSGLSIAFDLPTQTGYDSDHSLSDGEVGKVGVPISTIDDMEVLLKNIPLDKVSISMTINSTAAILLAMLIVVAEKNNIDKKLLKGTIQNDILKEYIARGTYIYPPKQSMRLITDIFEYCNKNVPKWNTISISGYHIREAGSTASQELGFTFSNAIEYVNAALNKGLQIDQFGKRLSFFFNCHIDFFEEIAKFRAARRIWANKLKYKYSAKDPRSLKLKFHTQTAGCSLTAQQPENNIARTGFQALSAVLGGTQSLHTNSMDETLSLPTEKAAEIALRTQQLIAHETGVTNVVDPLGGSWYVESLTDKMEMEVEEYFKEIDELGGVIPAIEKGYFQREIAKSASEYQKKIDEGSLIHVGVNKYIKDNEELEIPTLEIGEETEKIQKERIDNIRNKRDNNLVKESLNAIRNACANNNNIMESIINATKEDATLGEIIDVMKAEFGEWKETSAF